MSVQVRPGYKLTEVGVIPEDWNVFDYVSIGQIIDGDRGSNYPSADDLRDAGDCLFLNAGNVTKDGFRFHDCQFISADKDRVLNKGKLERGDVVLTTRGTLGNFAYFNETVPFEKLRINSGMVLLRSTSASLDLEFQYRMLKSRIVADQIERLSFGSAQPQLTVKGVGSLKIPLPPSQAEQEAIAEALSDADALIESMEQLIAKKRHLKQGVMQELLTPKNGWSVEKLEDIADVIDPHPSHRAPPEVSNGIPFVGIGDLNEDGDIVSTRLRTVAATVFDEHRTRYKIEDGLIGLGRVASIGKVVCLKDVGIPFAVSPTLGIIRGKKVSQNYLFQALKSRFIVDQFARIMSGSTRSSVGMVVLRQLDVPVPRTEAEQTAISMTLADMDAEIAELENQLAKTRALNQGMMRKLLTGEIRLL